ncbi:hypothetical protein Hanom_Chr16g01438981 [Helianthus anomalus]
MYIRFRFSISRLRCQASRTSRAQVVAPPSSYITSLIIPLGFKIPDIRIQHFSHFLSLRRRTFPVEITGVQAARRGFEWCLKIRRSFLLPFPSSKVHSHFHLTYTHVSSVSFDFVTFD